MSCHLWARIRLWAKRGKDVKSSYFDRLQDWLSEWDDDKTRHLLMVVLGVLVGLLIGLMVDAIAHRALPYLFNDNLNASIATDDLLAQHYKTDPFYNIRGNLWVAISWMFGSLAGGYVSVRMTKIGEFVAWFTGILLVSSYFIGMLDGPYPVWMWVICPLIVGAAAFGAGRLGDYINARRPS
jgi:hypothetical protein